MIAVRFLGLDDLGRYFGAVNKATTVATMRAINAEAARGRTLASRKIREQVGLKASYVNEKLKVRKATVTHLVAEISTPKRGLLLTRFANRQLTLRGRKAGIAVRVKPRGGFKKMPKAFYIRLRAGAEPGFNEGIAIRDQATNKVKVLHGPSISQVFNTVREDVAPELLEKYRTTLAREIQYAMRGVK